MPPERALHPQSDSSPDALLNMRRNELDSPVCIYADNLHAQITTTLQQLGVASIDELAEAARAGQVVPEKLADLRERLAALRTAVETNHIPTLEIEEKLKLYEQYERQKQLLTDAGILERFSSGKEGIKGIDGKEYPLPSYEDIRSRFETKHELLQQKVEQGFTKLLLVPFGMSLDKLIEKYKETILKHHRDGTLRSTTDETLELNESDPLYVWDAYKKADVEEKLVYYPERFTAEDHGGKTKQALLEEAPTAGWNIILIEDLPDIPRKDMGKTIGGRKQFEAGATPNQYLQDLQLTPLLEHRGEAGMTPEDQLLYAIAQLEEKNQVIDNYEDKGSVSYQLGGWLPASDSVPRAYWSRGGRQASLGRHYPDLQVGYCGVRAAVRV